MKCEHEIFKHSEDEKCNICPDQTKTEELDGKIEKILRPLVWEDYVDELKQTIKDLFNEVGENCADLEKRNEFLLNQTQDLNNVNTRLRKRIKDMEALIKEAWYIAEKGNVRFHMVIEGSTVRHEKHLNRLKAMNDEIGEEGDPMK